MSLEQRWHYDQIRDLFGKNIEGTFFIVLLNRWQKVGVMYIPSQETEIKVRFHSPDFNFKGLKENNQELWKEFQDRFIFLIQNEVPNEICDKQKILFEA